MHCSETDTWEQVRATFQKLWGYADFRPPQGEIVRSLLAQQDAVIILPTGGGKSLCFQLPALLQTGLTLVLSPLVALMENQVQELRQKRLPVGLLHGELPGWQKKQTLRALEQQKLRLLYLSPETLLSPPVWERLCQPELKINGLILDEAHCLVQWGETFRPAYYRLGAVRSALLQTKELGTKIAIAAFTATADLQDQQIIEHILQLENPQVFRLNPYRSNLHLAVNVVWTRRQRRQQILQFIQRQTGESGLIYVRTRQDSEDLAAWLQQQQVPTAAYHAGLGAEPRRQIEQDWLGDRLQCVVCTNAFGMGINKPNVRWVGHFHAPFLLSEYVQEIGRAGRDGKPATALTLVSEPTGLLEPEDSQRRQFFTQQIQRQQRHARELVPKLPIQGEVETVSKQFKDGAIALSLLHRQGYLEWVDPFHYQIKAEKCPSKRVKNKPATPQITTFLQTRVCRWSFLRSAFGFATEAQQFRCGHCDNCR